MAGIYIHIPFCKQACYYCDFHFSTSLKLKSELVDSICKELALQKSYLSEPVESIYFGGGTPSLLTANELDQIFNSIYTYFNVNDNIEITLEANPDDLTLAKLIELYSSRINRLSIGVQSFDDNHLKLMNRANNSEEARKAISKAKEMGFNLSLDLIYGIPSENHTILENDLNQLVSFQPNHISAYCLTIEEKTVFGNWAKKGKLNLVTDDFASEQFEKVVNTLGNGKYEQYEISNFCIDENYAVHNSSYWLGKSYLGVGPSAHSYNGISRSFNVTNNAKYIKSISDNITPNETEILSREDKINDLILTGSRTKWGVDVEKLKKEFDYDILSKAQSFIDDGLVLVEKEKLILTNKGKFLADFIAEKLFI